VIPTLPLHFEDLAAGQEYQSAGRTLTETDIVNFAMLSGDWNPLHVDAEVAKGSAFGRPVVHGMCGLAVMGGLMYAAGWFSTTVEALLGFEEVRFTAPIFPGDTITCRITIVSTRLSRRGRGVVVRQLELLNQRGELVQTCTSPVIIKRKEDRDPG
jgi:acyl dehydratase